MLKIENLRGLFIVLLVTVVTAVLYALIGREVYRRLARDSRGAEEAGWQSFFCASSL